MLSRRLQSIADLVEENRVVYDVGTDHALLPCFLALHKNCKVYACDNKAGPLQKAKENISKFGLQSKVVPILADGFDHSCADSQILTIAGMGYHSCVRILENCDLSIFSYIIVQINKNSDKFRQYISDHHYTIQEERVVFDQFYYEIEVFDTKHHDNYQDEEIRFGPINLVRKEKDFLSYLDYQESFYQEIYEKTMDESFLLRIKQIESIKNA